MDSVLSSATIFNGLILGWSVAWPPGPVNAEIIRRGTLPTAQGGGFWPGFQIGLGACIGDFLWALCVSAGAGAIINTPSVRLVLAAISFSLLLFLAWSFGRAAWQLAQHHRRASDAGIADDKKMSRRALSRGWLLGFLFVLTSPWNVGFWLAVIGSQANVLGGSFLRSVVFAASVVTGALVWGTVLCTGVKLGAHFFARPSWQIATQALTAVVMVYFAVRLALQFI